MLEIIGAVFIILFGSFLHFLYDLTKHNKIVGFFTAVNESTWEHLKLIIAPTFVWFIVELHFYANRPTLYFAQLISLLVMLLVIPLIFYTYRHFLKRDILFLDIASFILAAAAGQYVFHLLINCHVDSLLLTHLGIIGLIFIFFYYITRTYVPEHNFLHRDPITNRYGISGHPRSFIDKKHKS